MTRYRLKTFKGGMYRLVFIRAENIQEAIRKYAGDPEEILEVSTAYSADKLRPGQRAIFLPFADFIVNAIQSYAVQIENEEMITVRVATEDEAGEQDLGKDLIVDFGDTPMIRVYVQDLQGEEFWYGKRWKK